MAVGLHFGPFARFSRRWHGIAARRALPPEQRGTEKANSGETSARILRLFGLGGEPRCPRQTPPIQDPELRDSGSKGRQRARKQQQGRCLIRSTEHLRCPTGDRPSASKPEVADPSTLRLALRTLEFPCPYFKHGPGAFPVTRIWQSQDDNCGKGSWGRSHVV
ncbi:hypothetical protein BBK36DRAFT_153101 [Trichoderma citrinoviride]|uniref:Uncharacterized protein n=1 Tax=Trichoderma citrinoviride TaxID=58853 RepID=A0A2T4AXJ6_9HYPO|nr:hypothetical protein BBK36DRAFT_153101 [Trichoderma citrinoviride]PTB61814.1 hypothetical protein BBK36DRAFT_153101 [Trichoderma citrinoviride]